MNQNELISKVKHGVQSVDPDARVILFGSYARGEQRQLSDWDFLVLTSSSADESLKRKIIGSLIETGLEAEEVISTLIFSKEKWHELQITPLYKNIAIDGVEL